MAECLALETGSRRPRWNLHQRVQSRSRRKTTLLPRGRKAQATVVRASLSKQPTMPPCIMLSLAFGGGGWMYLCLAAQPDNSHVAYCGVIIRLGCKSPCVLNLAYQKSRKGRRREPKLAEQLGCFHPRAGGKTNGPVRSQFLSALKGSNSSLKPSGLGNAPPQ